MCYACFLNAMLAMRVLKVATFLILHSFLLLKLVLFLYTSTWGGEEVLIKHLSLLCKKKKKDESASVKTWTNEPLCRCAAALLPKHFIKIQSCDFVHCRNKKKVYLLSHHQQVPASYTFFFKHLHCLSGLYHPKHLSYPMASSFIIDSSNAFLSVKTPT